MHLHSACTATTESLPSPCVGPRGLHLVILPRPRLHACVWRIGLDRWCAPIRVPTVPGGTPRELRVLSAGKRAPGLRRSWTWTLPALPPHPLHPHLPPLHRLQPAFSEGSSSWPSGPASGEHRCLFRCFPCKGNDQSLQLCPR